VEFPDGLVVRILGFHCLGLGSIPDRETNNPQMCGIGTAPKSEIYLSSKTYGENKKSKCGRRYLKHI